MKKVPIVIASILKPTDDPRSFERFGISMAKTNKYDINIIGFGTKNNSDVPNISFHPLGDFPRLSFQRVMAKYRILKLLFELKPKLLILGTHELLTIGVLYKIMSKTVLVYDVRENYYRNLVYQSVFPKVIKHLLAIWVRLKEKILAQFLWNFILAETGYDKEFKFHKKKNFTVIQNKLYYESNDKAPKNRAWHKLVFTGNLSENSGVITAIQLTKLLHAIDQRITLLIVGYSPSAGFSEALNKSIHNHDFIQLIGGDSIVDHQEIIQYINESGTAIVSYQINPSNKNCIPTKVFEYIGLHIPIIADPSASWTSYADAFNLAIPFDFKSTSKSSLQTLLLTLKEERHPHHTRKVLWKTEETKLLAFIDEIIS